MEFKKLLPFLFFFIPLACLRAESQTIQGFRGLHNSDAAILIQDNEAQDLSNVDLTDSGAGVKKAEGYAQFKTVGISTHGVRGGYYFRDVLGNDNLIAANDRSVYYSRAGSAYTEFITTDTSGSYYDFTDSNGFLYRATSNHDKIARWDGTTTTYFPDAPKGSQVEVLPDRLAITGSTVSTNRVWFSGAADFTNFTTDIQESSPFYEDFGLPGQNITAAKTMCGGLGVFTKDTLSLWTGTNQFDGQIVSVSPNLGTLAPSTIIQDGGVTYWQAQDGKFYGFDCNSVTTISAPLNVSGFADGSGIASPVKWTQTETGDFNAGTVGSGLSVSGGSVGFADVVIDNFSDGDYTANPTWTTKTENASVSVSGGELLIDETGSYSTSANGSIYTAITSSTGTWKLDARATASNARYQSLLLKLCQSAPTKTATETGCYAAEFAGDLGGGYIRVIKDASTVLISSGSFANPLGQIKTTSKNVFLERLADGTLRAGYDGTIYVSATDTAITGLSYFQVGWNHTSGDDTRDLYADNIVFVPTSASFLSAPHATGSISSWGLFQADNTLNGGAITYSIYSDTDTSFSRTITATFTSSQTIASGNIPTIPTAAYFTIAADFSRTVSTQTVFLNSFDMNWNGGLSMRHYGAVDVNHRLLWSVDDGGVKTSYIFDQRFGSWLKYSFPFYSPIVVGKQIYFGDPSAGTVYNWPSGNTFNGSAITSYWKSKDFVSGSAFTEKTFNNYSFVGKAYPGSNLDFSYDVDSLGATTVNFSLTDPLSSVTRKFNDNFPSGTVGSLINFKFGNDDADAPFEVHAFSYDYTPRPWRVMQ